MYDIFYISKNNNKDDWEKIKSRYPRAQKLTNIDNYDQIRSKAFTKMFWVIWDDLELNENFDLNSYTATSWDDMYVHVFKNDIHYDGICLFSKKTEISKKEFDNRFYFQKKQINVCASMPKKDFYDTVFISYDEIEADKNYANLLKKVPTAKRVHGVKGIHQAHVAAAELVETDLFWVVDGDAVILEDFNFEAEYVPYYDVVNKKNFLKTVRVWQSQNPINELIYGYGGVKLLPRELTLNMDLTSIDMTTSISEFFRPINDVSNITQFNTDPFNTWKSAFRECVKLSSKLIERQKKGETEKRLDIWCNQAVGEYSEYAIKGARAGKMYGYDNRNNKEALKKINDFAWLKEKFDAR